VVKNYGCAGCHEISGLEDEPRLGTELTTEGSKPSSAWISPATDGRQSAVPFPTEGSLRGPWYDQKGFFEQKLARPAVYDKDKYKPDPRRPAEDAKPNVTADDIKRTDDLSVGKRRSAVTAGLHVQPGDARTTSRRAGGSLPNITAMGCHQVHIGQQSVLQNLPHIRATNKIKLHRALIPKWRARVRPNGSRTSSPHPR